MLKIDLHINILLETIHIYRFYDFRFANLIQS